MKSLGIIILTSSIFLLGCQQNNSEEARRQFQASIVKNNEAKSYTEWINSEYHPESIFSFWRENKFSSEKVCNELKKLNDLDLTIFEDEINNKENSEILKMCQSEMELRLKNYWEKEKNLWKDYPVNFETQRREIQVDSVIKKRVVRGALTKNQVMLTFDDGPHKEYTLELLDILNSVNIKAMFFILGRNARNYPNVVREQAFLGHTLGTHSFSHRCLGDTKNCRKSKEGFLSLSNSLEEVETGFLAVINILGWVHPFFRFPYGEASENISRELTRKGISEFFWSIDSEDWRRQSTSQLLKTTIRKIEKDQGGNILFHDIQKRTITIMRPLIYELNKKGFTFVVYRASPLRSYENGY